MISLVAASERETAQTTLKWGCRTVYIELQNLMIAETFGKM